MDTDRKNTLLVSREGRVPAGELEAFNSAGDQTEPHILSVIPRGEVIRNFVHSGCFDHIAERAKLSLLTVVNDLSLSEVFRRSDVGLHSLESVMEKWPVRIQRDILDLAHGRWLWSMAAQERWRLRDAESKSVKKRLARLAKKSVAVPFANKLGLSLLSKSERLASRVLNPTQEFLDLFRRIRPTLVFNGSHIHSAIATPAVQAAQWLKIPTATFIFSWDNLTSQGRIILPYDYYLVWSEDLKSQLVQMYERIKPENVFVTGTPQFDPHFDKKFYWSRERFCAEIGADSRRPIILYSTGMAHHMPGEPEIVEMIADLLNEYQDRPRPQLLVRVYAKDRTGRFEDLKRRRRDIIFQRVEWDTSWLTPKYEDSYGLINALRHCSVGINIASTISLELCMFDKPVINVAFDPPSGNALGLENLRFYSFDHYKPVVESGAVELALSKEELRRSLRSALNDPTARSENRKHLMARMFGNMLDGRSAERVSDTLLSIASSQLR